MSDAEPVWLGLFGAGGHARETLPAALAMAEARHAQGFHPDRVVFVDSTGGRRLDGALVLHEGEFLALPGRRCFAVGIGNGESRKRVFQTAVAAGAVPVSVIDPRAAVSAAADVAPGALIAPFAFIGPGARIGVGFIANVFSQLSHDTQVGDFVTLSPHASVNGNVHLGDGAVVGAGAVIRNGTPDRPLSIGVGAVVGMGAVVVADVADGATVAGVPARPLYRTDS